MAYSKKAGAKHQSDAHVNAYRLVAPRWSNSALSGEGARKYGGRWNSPGLPVVYLGSSRALTALELLVHLTTPGSRKKSYALIEVTLPRNSIIEVPLATMPDDWPPSPPTADTMHIGDSWLASGKSLALSLPSTIVPEENNVLINPLHPDFSKVTASAPVAFNFDPRL